MIMKANKQIGFIYKDEESIDKILKDGDVVFERGFLREKTSTTLPITFGGVGKDLKDYRVYGNTYQRTTDGKNLIPNNKISRTNQGVTFTPQEDGTYLINGQNTTNSNAVVYIHQGDFNLQAGTYYGIPTGDNNVTVTMYVRFSDDTRQYINLEKINNINKQIIYADIYIQVKRNTSTIFNDYKVYPMLSATPITVDDYEPYTGGQPSPNPDYPQEIISCGDLITDSQDENYGKYKIPVNVRSDNLFDKDNANTFIGYITSTKISGSGQAKTLYIPCKPNTSYTITKILSARFMVGTTGNTPIIDESVIDYLSNNTATKLTITTSANAKYLCVYYYHSSYDTLTEQQILDSIMIVEGSTAPSKYIPYYNETTNIYLDEPLRKIDEYSDYIDFKNGKVVRNISEIVLDGSESWVTASAGQGAVRFVCNTYQDTKIPSNLDTIGGILSNKFIPKTANQTSNKIDGIAIAGSGKFVIYYGPFKEYSATNFKTWLSSNNVTVDYVLETPTEESITLPNIPTIDGNNTLNIETEITPSKVYIKYKSNE